MPRPEPATTYRRRRLLAAFALVALVVLVAGGVHLVTRSDDTSARIQAPQRTQAAVGAARDRSVRTETVPTTTTSTTTPTGRFQLAQGGTGVVGSGRTYRYRVEVEDGTGIDVADFVAAVDRILGDRRGWTTADGISLQRVSEGPVDFAVRLATPPTTDLLCAPLETQGRVSCGHDAMAVINLTRWLEGAEPSGLDLAGYRDYLITHEVGHLLGHGHEPCRGPGQRATTMMQQTHGIGDCTPNPWPAPDA